MLHQNAYLGDIHVPHNWEVANANARAALTVDVSDNGKYCRQLDNNSVWMLVSTTPITWSRITGNMDGREAALLELLPPTSSGTKTLISVDGAVSWGAAPTGVATSSYPQILVDIPDGDTMIVLTGYQCVVEEEMEIGVGSNLEIQSGGNLIIRA